MQSSVPVCPVDAVGCPVFRIVDALAREVIRICLLLSTPAQYNINHHGLKLKLPPTPHCVQNLTRCRQKVVQCGSLDNWMNTFEMVGIIVSDI